MRKSSYSFIFTWKEGASSIFYFCQETLVLSPMNFMSMALTEMRLFSLLSVFRISMRPPVWSIAFRVSRRYFYYSETGFITSLLELAAAFTGLVVPTSAYSIPGMWPASLFSLKRFTSGTFRYFGFKLALCESASNLPLILSTFFCVFDKEVLTNGLRATSWIIPDFDSMICNLGGTTTPWIRSVYPCWSAMSYWTRSKSSGL